MPDQDFRSPRLYVDAPLHVGAALALQRDQANYLGNVLRLRAGDYVLVFNGRDGEWRTEIAAGKRVDRLTAIARTRAQDMLPDVHLLFAPLKHARLDYMVQKAVEMGVSQLQPVLTRFTQVSRINLERMRANVVEAAEQCGILTLANVDEPVKLTSFLQSRDGGRALIFCDEAAPSAGPLQSLAAAKAKHGIDVLIGPEGGFGPEEREALLKQPNVTRMALGPRILRADTAAVAALALVQSAAGDWTSS